MPVREYYPGVKPYRMLYMEDPFGSILEIYSHSYALTYSAGAYQTPALGGGQSDLLKFAALFR